MAIPLNQPQQSDDIMLNYIIVLIENVPGKLSVFSREMCTAEKKTIFCVNKNDLASLKITTIAVNIKYTTNIFASDRIAITR